MPRFGTRVAAERRLLAGCAGGKAVGEVAAGQHRAVGAAAGGLREALQIELRARLASARGCAR